MQQQSKLQREAAETTSRLEREMSLLRESLESLKGSMGPVEGRDCQDGPGQTGRGLEDRLRRHEEILSASVATCAFTTSFQATI